MIRVQVNMPAEFLLLGAESGLEGVTVEVYDPTDGSVVLAPSSAGITEPRDQTYRCERTVPSVGTFLIRWADAEELDLGEEELEVTAEPVVSLGVGMIPSVAEVGALLRARTVDNNGNQIGTFNENTRPTGATVETLILSALNRISSKVGVELPETVHPMARHLIALRTVMLIELGYYPEQVGSDKSAYDQYKAMYDEELTDLVEAAKDAWEGGDPGGVDDRPGAYGSFGDGTGMIGMRTPL